ncbi:neural cell adhesion molecule 1 [Eurytemora carolleeae]|uniref:neural cell adhesion molecule 1 n=1 Tax=Eurytemora carolleeae TaxID=1294199 RepID=UPI000C778B9F|nr:neural cell adhesion molecule 1 [Eurytemora carolleeae]|eukprot:XP_023339713.1 neural cell adhesion molecule 1-like [Eurytemora affinis]
MRAEERILGGLEAGFKQFPWAAIVTVTGNNIDKMCAGTLISLRFVATAGHCTSYCKDQAHPECKRPVPADELTFKVQLGEYDYVNRRPNQETRTYHAVNLFLHPDYRSNIRLVETGFLESDPKYDIAILKLDRAVKPSSYITPICLPEVGQLLFPDLATVIGWGRIGRYVGDPHSSVLQAVTVPVLSAEECAEMDGSSYPSPDQICAGLSNSDQSSCPGDSGGGLMTRDMEERWFLIGIVSTGLSLDSQISYNREEPKLHEIKDQSRRKQDSPRIDRQGSIRPDGQRVERDSQLPEIMTQDGNIRVERGDTARLTCEVAGLGNYVLMWKEKQRVISAGNLMVRKDPRFQLSVKDGVFVLYIRNVQREDAGDYICEVDVLGRPLRGKQILEVLVPPVVQTRENKVDLYKGDNYTLSCSGQGYPNPRIIWSKQGGYMRRPGYEGLSLPLTNVNRQDSGNYICQASNGVSTPAQAVITVRVKYPPEVEMEQNWLKSESGTEIDIDCIVYSDPSPQVTWFRNSGKIFETDRLLMTEKPGRWTIKIIDIRESDFGNYSCRATNLLGKASAVSVISGRPSPPRFTSHSVNFQSSVYNLTWTCESVSKVTEYKLRYRQSKDSNSEGGVWSELVLPVSEPTLQYHYTLRELKPGSVYDVVGFSRNKYGWSMHSKTFTFFNKGVDFSTQELIKKKLRETEEEEERARQKEEILITSLSSDSVTWLIDLRIGVMSIILFIQ